MSQQTTAKKLYDVLTVRNFEDLKALDSRTSRPPVNDQGQPDVSQADMFSFDWTAQSGRDYGTVVILLTADSELELYFGDNLGRGMEPEDKQDWYDFLLQIKQFATRNFLGFKPQNINRLKFSLAGQAAINEGLFESWRGTATTSWNGNTTEARIMVRHKRRLGENDARYRYIESVFIETVDGERYRLPFVKLSGAKAMLEHVRHGGRPYDSRGQHIASMVEELNVLSRFRRAVRGQVLEGVSASLVEQTSSYYESLGRQLNRLHTSRGYQSYFESWSPAEVSDQDIMVEDLRSMFVEQSLDTRIEAALPVLARIHQGKNMKEVTVFEQWVNGLVEGTWALPNTPEKQQQLIELMSQELPVGADATNAAQQLYSLIGDDDLFDMLGDLADSNADADARPAVAYWMSEHLDNPVIAAVYEKVPADVKPEAFMPPAQDSAVTEQQHDTADHDADLDSILRSAGVPAKPKAAPDYQTGVTESAMSEVYSALSDIAETNDLDELDFLMRDSGPAGRYVQNMAAELAAQHNLDATDDHDQMLQMVMDQIQQQVGESVTEARMPLAGHPYHDKSAAELRYIMKDAGEAAVAMRDHDARAEAKYLDQVNDAATVLHYRKDKQGMAESDKLQGTPVVSLSDFGDKDNTKDKYGRTVPKKLKKDDPRVQFHKENDRKQGVAEGLEDMSTQKAITDTAERLFRKNKMDDYDSLEAVRQGVKHHFSKPGATAESAIDGILNILTKRMRKSGNYVDLNRFREALRQGVAHQLKKQGVTEASFTAAAAMHAATRKQSGGKTAQPTHGIKVGDEVTTADGKKGQVHFVQGDTVHVKGTNPYFPDKIKHYSASDLKKGLAEGKKQQEYKVYIQDTDGSERLGSTITAKSLGHARELAKQQGLKNITSIELKKQGVAEGGMPASVIRAKERMAQASDEELYSKFQELSSKTGRSVQELALSMARRHGYGQDSGKYWDRISHLALDKPMDEAKTCNMSESGTMCSEHGLAECGMSEDDNSIPVDHQEQDPIEGLKSLLGRLRT